MVANDNASLVILTKTIAYTIGSFALFVCLFAFALTVANTVYTVHTCAARRGAHTITHVYEIYFNIPVVSSLQKYARSLLHFSLDRLQFQLCLLCTITYTHTNDSH